MQLLSAIIDALQSLQKLLGLPSQLSKLERNIMTAFDSVRTSLNAQNTQVSSLLTDVANELQQVSALAQSIKAKLDAESQVEADQLVAMIDANTAKINEAAESVRNFVVDEAPTPEPSPEPQPESPVSASKNC